MRRHRDKLVASGKGFRQLLPRRFPLTFHLLSERDVAGDFGGADDMTLGILDRRNRERDVQSAAVLGLPYGLEVVYLFAAPELTQHVVFLSLQLRRDDHSKRSTNCLLRRVSEHLLRGG